MSMCDYVLTICDIHDTLQTACENLQTLQLQCTWAQKLSDEILVYKMSETRYEVIRFLDYKIESRGRSETRYCQKKHFVHCAFKCHDQKSTVRAKACPSAV